MAGADGAGGDTRRDHEALLLDLWRRWFAVGPALTSPGPDEPRLLAIARAVAATTKVFGFQNHLLDQRDPDAAGIVAVFSENQAVWQIGYLPDGTDEPDGVGYNAYSGQVFDIVDRGFSELLYRVAFEEAVFAGPVTRVGLHVPGEVVDAIVDFAVLPQRRAGDDFHLPALWDLGSALAIGFEVDGWDLVVAASDPSAFRHGRLASLDPWLADEVP